ncbi:hypothetical protein [Microtetraspora glauca]|uniref:Uncharacterized protein n=1 Tax=Microtetraspora glauca TaxID=1996 RepID=A0ABV3GC31_MICGL
MFVRLSRTPSAGAPAGRREYVKSGRGTRASPPIMIERGRGAGSGFNAAASSWDRGPPIPFGDRGDRLIPPAWMFFEIPGN